MIEYLAAIEGLDTIEKIKQLGDGELELIIQRSINKSLRDTRSSASKVIYGEVDFPNGYLSPRSKRLTVSEQAKPGSLKGSITARDRPTSLARFAKGSNKEGVFVGVKFGSPKFIKRAFIMKLKGGNEGLALRVPYGTTPSKSYKPYKINPRLFLLYGPSVEQVFKSVADRETPTAINLFEREFERLVEYQLRK